MAGNGYILNSTPYALNFIVNSGTPTRVNAIRPTPSPNTPGIGTLASNAYVVPYSNSLEPDQLAGTSNPSGSPPNSLYVSGPPYVGGLSPTYRISIDMNVVPLTSDVYVWVFVDAVYACDSAGQSYGFTITKAMMPANQELA
jgi:hypothetical protein